MRYEGETALVRCESCHKVALAADADKWFKMTQARSEMLPLPIDRLSNLDFCKPECVQEWMDKEIIVSFFDHTNLTAADNTCDLGLIEFLEVCLYGRPDQADGSN